MRQTRQLFATRQCQAHGLLNLHLHVSELLFSGFTALCAGFLHNLPFNLSLDYVKPLLF